MQTGSPKYRKVLITALLLSCCLTFNASALQLQTIDSPATGHSAQPHLAKGADGTLLLSWLEHADGHATLRFAQLHEHAWQPAQTVTSGRDWFVNWADFPSVVPINDNLWAAHWLHKRPGGTYAYDVALSVSTDNGKSWSAQLTPHNDGTPTEHGFVSLFPWQDGVGVLWLDGRNMLESEHGESTDRSIQDSGMTLRSVVVSSDGELHNPQLTDGLVCDCCQTDVAMLPQGPVAVYRNRTADEIRDIQVVRAVDNQWQTPTTLNDDHWHIAGCPVNGPAISARERQIAAVWFTGADEQPRVRLAFSTDAGQSFGQAIDVDDQLPIGRVDVELLPDGGAAVLWACTRNKAQALCLRRVTDNNHLGPIKQLDSIGKSGGFPQLALIDTSLVLAWVESQGEISQVRTAQVSLDLL